MVAPLAEVYCLLGELKAASCWFIPTLSPLSYTFIQLAYLYPTLHYIFEMYLFTFLVVFQYRISAWLCSVHTIDGLAAKLDFYQNL